MEKGIVLKVFVFLVLFSSTYTVHFRKLCVILTCCITYFIYQGNKCNFKGSLSLFDRIIMRAYRQYVIVNCGSTAVTQLWDLCLHTANYE